MKYLAIAYLPAKKDQKFLRLDELLNSTVADLTKQMNKDGYILYQTMLSADLDNAREFLQALHAPVDLECTPSQQDKLMRARLTHVVLEVPDDADLTKPLTGSATRVYLLQPEGYAHLEINHALDENERRVALLVLEDNIEELASALLQQEKLKEHLQELIAQPFIVFNGPQFEHLHKFVQATVQREASPEVTRRFNQRANNEAMHNNNNNNNNEGEDDYQRRGQPSLVGMYARVVSRADVNPDEDCESSAAKRHV